jgi:hypothetical protein
MDASAGVPSMVFGKEEHAMPNERDRSRLPVFSMHTGNEPVREWLKDLDPEASQGNGNRSPTRAGAMANRHAGVQDLGKGLWEVRAGLPSNRTARVLFFVHEGRITDAEPE